MKRTRLVALCSFVFVASGATIFACSGDDTGNDGGTDAKADQTKSDGGADAGKDATVNDSGNDATLGDGGNDATVDATGDDGAADGATADGATADGAIDSGTTDAGMATTFMVLRVGGDVDAGADAALSSSATQGYVEERNISDGSLVRVIALPTAADDAGNAPLTLQGNSTSEGSLTRSVDGHYIVIGGYATVPGTASVSGTAVDAGVPRVIARVDKNGMIDTTTELDAFNKKNIRGAASNDGTAFWATGNGNSSEGPQYVVFGSTGATVNLSTALANTRVVQIFGGQVYISSGSGAFKGISAVGTGMPTTTGQTLTLLPGMPGDAGSPYGFAMLDQDGSVSGLDVLYVADDGVQSSTPGINKWVFDGSNWTKVATFTDQSTTGFRGVTAYIDGANVVVLGTTGDSTNPNTVVKYVDDGQTTNPTGTILATAPANCAFRGIALSPQ